MNCSERNGATLAATLRCTLNGTLPQTYQLSRTLTRHQRAAKRTICTFHPQLCPPGSRRAGRTRRLRCGMTQNAVSSRSHSTAPLASTSAQRNTDKHKDAPNPLRIMTQLGATESRSFVSAVSITDIDYGLSPMLLLQRLKFCFYASVNVKANLGEASKFQLGHPI